MTDADSTAIRLQKFLSDAGVASRRHAEEMVVGGHVFVNGRLVDTLPAFVDPSRDQVAVDGIPVRPQRLDYFIVHKPRGVVCTNSDPAGRVRAVDLLPDLPTRLFPVGRLDAESTGLLLLTNDGELAQRLTHPRYGVAKTYRAEVAGQVASELPAQMKRGVYLAEGRARASEVKVIHASRQRSVLLITLREGRNREVRRILARLGHPVRTLKRVQFGPLSLRGLPLGAARRLSLQELAELRRECEAAAEPIGRSPGMTHRRSRGVSRSKSPRRTDEQQSNQRRSGSERPTERRVGSKRTDGQRPPSKRPAEQRSGSKGGASRRQGPAPGRRSSRPGDDGAGTGRRIVR